MKSRTGFTLIELIVALSIGAVVLLAINGVIAPMLRHQIESVGKAESTTWSLIGLDQMTRDLQDASYLKTPASGTAAEGSAFLHGCHDYSKAMADATNGNGVIDGNPANLSSFYYCVAQIDADPAGSPVLGLLRFTQNACPMNNPAPPACPTPCSPPACSVIARGVGPGSPTATCRNNFCRADDTGGVEVSFQVGVATSTNYPTPRYARINTKIGMSKSYSNQAD